MESAVEDRASEDSSDTLHIGDTILLCASEGRYVFSKISSNSRSVALSSEAPEEPLPYVQYAAFKIKAALSSEAQKTPGSLNEKRVRWKEKDAQTMQNQSAVEKKPIVYGEKIQFQHTFTEKFLAVLTNCVSNTEATELKVELHEQGHTCTFRVLPRQRNHCIGDEVHFGDEVKFESLTAERMFLQWSEKPFGKDNPLYSDCSELNISARTDRCSFKIEPFYRPSQSLKHQSKIFRAGNPVLLFNKENECYVRAEGSFGRNSESIVPVHCRKCRATAAGLRLQCSSADRFWQFEKKDKAMNGEPVSWNECCYIKHLPTLCYLTVQYDGNKFQLILKPWNEIHENKSASLFYISPLKEGTTDCEAIFMERTFVKIKHIHNNSCLWLHMHKECESQEQSSDEKTFQLGLSAECASAFLFDVVTTEYVRHFHYVAGIVPVLTSYLEQCQKDECLSDSQDVRDTLDNLSKFIIQKLRPEGLKSRQKCLRNLQVLEIITEILAWYSKSHRTTDPTESQKAVCRSCYKVFQSYLRGGSRKNKEYLQREGCTFVPTFWNQLDQGLGAEETLVMLFEDNLEIICNPQKLPIECEDVSGLIAKLSGMVDITRKKTHNYMRMLSALCSFEGRPVRAVQNAVLKEFIEKRGDELFCSVTKKQGEDVLVFCQPGKDPLNLSALDKDDKKFLESQLQLLSSVRKGNSGAKEHVDKHCLFCCIGHKGKNLGKRLQARYVELLTVAFVEDEANTVSRTFPLLAVNGQDGDDDLHPPTTEVEKLMEWIDADDANGAFEVMKEDEKMFKPGILDFHQRNEAILGFGMKFGCDDDANYLLLKILDLIYALVQHGYYFNVKNTRKLLKKLLCLLDGSTDQPEHNASSDACTLFNTKRRFEFVHQNSSLFAVKQRAMEVIDLMWNIHLHRLLKRFISCFNTLEGPTQELVLHEYRLYLMSHEDKLSSLQEKDPAVFTKLSAAVRRHMKKVIFNSSTWPFHDLQKFSDIMLNLARYEKDELIQTSLHLLNQFYSCEATLFERAAQLQLLENNSDGHEVCKNVKQKLPKIRRFMSIIGAYKSESNEFCGILQELGRHCRPVEGHQEPQNQAILYKSGVVDDVVDYVLHNPSRLCAIESDRERVFGACFNFLTDVACKNPPIKQRLFNHLDDFLEIDVAVPSLARMLTEIFDGGPSLCLKVNEEQVEMIFHKIQKTATSDPNECVQLLITLQAIAKVEDLHLPLKRNQAIIIQYFNRMRKEAFDGFLQKSDDRWRILTAANETTELRLLMEVTNLLASCAEGENAYIESLCQTIYTQQDLLDILMAPEDRLEHSSEGSSQNCIPVARKGPFLRYLHWVYMSTKHCDRKRDASLAYNFWNYMGLLKACLKKVSDFLLSGGKSHSRTIRVALTSEHKRQSLDPHTPKLQRLISEISPDNTEAVLRYVLEAVLPMLKTFYLKFFPLLKEEDEGYAEKAQTSAAICHNLLRLSGVVQSIFTNERQLQVYKEAVMAMLTNKHVWIGLLTTPRYREGFSRFDETFTRQRRLRTLSRHNAFQETPTEKLNKRFHTFVLNYTTSWEGLNTAEVQIESEFKQPYNAHESDQIQKGDWNLPLGIRFQEHVSLFLMNSDGEKRVSSKVELLIEQLSVSFRRSFRKHFKFPSEADFHKHVQLNIKCLQLLRAIIRNRLQHIDSELQVTNPKEFQMRCKKELHPWQKEIQDRGTIDAVIPFLVHPHETISREVLALLNSILTSASIDIIRGLAPLLGNDQYMECFTSVMHKKFQEASLKYMTSLAFLEELQLQRVTWENVKREYLSNQKIHAARMSIGEDQLKAAIEQINARDEPISPNETAVTIESSWRICRRPRQMRQRNPELPLQVINRRHTRLEESQGLIEPGSNEVDYASSLPIMHQALFRQASVPHADPLDTATGIVKWNIVLDTLLRVQCSSYIRLALKFLDHACSMRYSDMQNYLRERPNHVSPINVVGDVAIFLENFQNGEQFHFQPFQFNFVDDLITEKEVKLKWSKENAQLIHLALQSLTKFCIGNQQNKEAVFNRRILDVINCVLRVDIQMVEEEVEDFNRSIENNSSQPDDAEIATAHSTGTDSSAELRNDTHKKRLKKCHKKAKESVTRLIKLKGSAVKLLEVLLEKTDDAADRLARVVYRSLDVKALLKTMAELYQLRSSHITGHRLAERYLLKSYHIMKMFVDYSCLTQQDLDEWTHKEKANQSNEVQRQPAASTQQGSLEEVTESDQTENMATFCETHTKSVEVLYEGTRNGRGKKKLLTRLHFDYDPKHEIRGEVRNIAKWKVNRDSAEDKLRDFLDWIEALKRDIKWQHTLNLKFHTQLVKAFPWIRQWLLVFLTLLLNLFVFINFTVPSELQANPSNESATDNSSDSTIGGLVWLPETRDWFKIVLYIFGIPHAILSLWMLLEYFVLYWPHFLRCNYYRELMNYKLKKFIREYMYFHLQSSVLYEKSLRESYCPQRRYLQYHLFGIWGLYLLAFLAASIFSLVYCGYFYCLCLLHLVAVSQLLQRVLHAIILTWKSLVLVGLLGLVVLIIYAVASFAWLQDAFVSSENPLFCSTPGECFVTLLRYGVLDHILIPTDPEEFDQFGLRVLVNVVFLILWVIIGLNIILGLLLQSFLDLREKRNKTKEDMHSCCFICSFPSYEFELWAEPRYFAVHVFNDHNMWDYVYLSLYLDCHDIDEHTAVEKYVFDELQQHNIGFFPLKFSRALKHFEEEGSELEVLREHLKEKESEMATLHERLKGEESELAILREHLKERESEMATLHKCLKEEGSELATLREHLKEKESKLEALHEHLKEKESEMAILHERLKGKGSELGALREHLKENESEMATLHECLKGEGSELAILREYLKEKESELTTLREHLRKEESEKLILLREIYSAVQQQRTSEKDGKQDLESEASQ